MRFTFTLLLSSITLAAASALGERASECRHITAEEAASARQKLTKAKIFPDLVPASTYEGTSKVTGKYGAKAIRFGNKFTVAETRSPPKIHFTAEMAHDPATTKYSVFMVDPDVPMKSDISMPFLHWYYAHASARCIKKAPAVQEVTGYELPTPASVSQHRYTFLVYREPKGYKPQAIPAQLRPIFNVTDYTQKAGLKLVGANYFLEGLTNT